MVIPFRLLGWALWFAIYPALLPVTIPLSIGTALIQEGILRARSK